MSPSFLFTLTSSFLIGLAAHIVTWRVRRPKDDAATLMHLIVTLPLAVSVLAILSKGQTGMDALNAAGLAVMFHVGTGFTYMSLYTASQAASPTALVLIALARHKNTGLTIEQINELFTTDQLAGNSIHSAIDEGFLLESGKKLALGPRGASLIRVCGGLRRILRLPPGRG